ncbi:uncharacterized protein LOC102452743 isoform X3 [Pelodiscus sinensis]|uniref:uncharacterized protein LOC102452743 isoform X3 n=1 Tax=Pelodiscus sinensis TaxID=13735 RepID=UPI003F6A5E2C
MTQRLAPGVEAERHVHTTQLPVQSDRLGMARTLLLLGVPVAPSLSLQPQKPEYLPGDTVEMTCTAPPSVAGIQGFQFNNDIGKSISVTTSSTRIEIYNTSLMGSQDGGLYYCRYWVIEADSVIKSNWSNKIPIRVRDYPPWPVLTVDPPSGVVRDGLPLIITCTAPANPRERRFHFYKDGGNFSLEDMGLEGNAAEMRARSRNFRIPQAGPDSTGEFACAYEENMNGRWLLSFKSLAVNVTMTERSNFWVGQLALCGLFFATNGLLFLLFHLYMMREGRKPTQGSARGQGEYCSVPFRLVTDQPRQSGPATASEPPAPRSYPAETTNTRNRCEGSSPDGAC